jgi:hypothetical protein
LVENPNVTSWLGRDLRLQDGSAAEVKPSFNRAAHNNWTVTFGRSPFQANFRRVSKAQCSRTLLGNVLSFGIVPSRVPLRFMGFRVVQSALFIAIRARPPTRYITEIVIANHPTEYPSPSVQLQPGSWKDGYDLPRTLGLESGLWKFKVRGKEPGRIGREAPSRSRIAIM